jgi:hypothetical protein
VLTLSGEIAADHAAELQTLLDADADVDLKNLTIIDRVGVLRRNSGLFTDADLLAFIKS